MDPLASINSFHVPAVGYLVACGCSEKISSRFITTASAAVCRFVDILGIEIFNLLSVNEKSALVPDVDIFSYLSKKRKTE